MRTTRLAVIGLSLVGLFGACAGGDSKSDAAKTSNTANTSDTANATMTGAVSVKDFAFGPKSVTVKTGGTVTWTNNDTFDHSVQIDELQLDGPKFGPQTMPATYSHQFTKPGTYDYICGVHNSMTGTVIVTN